MIQKIWPKLKQTVNLNPLFKRGLFAVALTIATFIAITYGVYLVYYTKTTGRLISFSGKSCIPALIYFPRDSSTASNNVDVTVESILKVRDFKLLGTSVCMAPKTLPSSPEDYSVTLRPFGIDMLRKQVTLKVSGYPQVVANTAVDQPLPAQKALEFSLTADDKMFTYELAAGDKTKVCEQDDATLRCELKDLGLTQGNTYGLTVERFYHGEHVDSPFSSSVQIIEPLVVSSSSIANDAVLYDLPGSLSLETNKPFVGTPKVSLSDQAGAAVPVTVTANTRSLQIAFGSPLTAKTSYILKIETATATDGSMLANPYLLHFRLSGGPAVTGTNTANSAVLLSQKIVVNFDQPLDGNQDLQSAFSLTQDGKAIPFRLVHLDSGIRLEPLNGLDWCANYQLTVNSIVRSPIGRTGDSAYSQNFRTSCIRTELVGTSVLGRPIIAYILGSGPKRFVYVGAIHGGERSSKSVLDAWISELDRSFQNIPANVTVIVIPNLNPDGYVKNSRFNEHGVDLNRNFATADWSAATYSDANTLLPNGGGSSPLSEPESASFAAYMNAIQPRLIITYHSQAGYVIANDAGDSSALAKDYARRTDYRAFDGSTYSSAFDYNVSGTLEDWSREAIGKPALLVELWSHYDSDFYNQRDAMWAMLKN